MTPQHLSDEAVAAFADGVLSGHARERATKHTANCPECALAVRVQREAAFALRAAPAPALPTDLLDRLRGLPQVTPIRSVPTVIASDGSVMFSTLAPVAAFAPAAPRRAGRRPSGRTMVTTAAAVALAGALATGGVALAEDKSTTGRNANYVSDDRVAHEIAPDLMVTSVSVFRSGGH